MAKKKKKEKFKLFNIFENLKDETVHGMWAIAFFILAIFLVLSSFGIAGIVGETIFTTFSLLFGIGYYLLPILFFVLSFSFFNSMRYKIGVGRIIGSALFFISGLGLVEMVFSDKGGVVGKLITTPLIALFDVYSTILILSGLLIISILILFNTKLPSLSFIKNIFKRKKGEKNDVDVYDKDENLEEGDDLEEDDESDDEDVEEEDKDDEEEDVSEENDILADTAKDKKSLKNIFGFKKQKYNSGESERESDYTPPPLSMLEKDSGKPGVGDIKANANIIKRTLQNFGVRVEIDEISIGPTVTRYALKPAEGVRLSKIIGLQNNLELALAAHPVRIEAPIPGKSLVGIEVPNSSKATVGLANMLGAEEFQTSDKPLLISLGKDISGHAFFANIAKMPHLLIAGATGAGKSVAIHAIITSLLFRNSPQDMRLILIDPKRVELTLYNNIPHLLTPVITDAKKTILALKWAAKEMDRRYDILESESVRDIASYHKNIVNDKKSAKNKNKGEGDEENTEEGVENMPYIIIVIDELADIMQAYPRELESAIVRLAQMSRAVGIHLILSTQRPSVNIITGLIKANIPTRIALQVSSQIDSRTILDMGGAEKLLGAGDMLYLSGEMSKPKRIQAPFISEGEVKKVVKFLVKNSVDSLLEGPNEIDLTSNETVNGKNAIFESDISDNTEDDEMYEEAKEIVVRAKKASTSYLQRKLRIGYARAARLMDIMEENGVIGPADGSKPREVLERDDTQEDIEEEENGEDTEDR